jgi:hypothetical protein
LSGNGGGAGTVPGSFTGGGGGVTDLPFTGIPVAWLLAVGLALIVGGTSLLTVLQYRRTD